MDLKFEVSGRIARPVDDVFEAVVNPEQLSGYFTTGSARGRLETGATVMWDFHDFPGAFPVEVVEVVGEPAPAPAPAARPCGPAPAPAPAPALAPAPAPAPAVAAKPSSAAF
jgi:hypothetical protein